MNIVGIVPARGGSKGVPRKNIVQVGGRPLIAWTIEAAVEADCFSRVIVTTDCEETAEIALQWGAEVPFLRPSELAQDQTSGVDPIIHCLDWMEGHEKCIPDAVMLLQPTSPLRTSGDILNAIKVFQSKRGDSVIACREVRDHPYWTKRIMSDGRAEDFIPDGLKAFPTRQQLPPLYMVNGAIYVFRREVVLKNRSFYGEKNYAYIMPAERSWDIDSPSDLKICEFLLESRLSQTESAIESHE